MFKSKFFVPVFFFLLLGNVLRAQTVPTDLDSLLRHTLDSMRSLLNVRSLSAAMQFTGGEVWAHADGVSSLVPYQAATPAHRYLIGSVTKTITSACILQMADENLLNIDDSLYEWLDTIPFVDPNITIRQLMQHTSGIYDVLLHPNNQDSMQADITRVWTAKELIDNFISPPLFQPGTGWSYSNTNYFLLGMIIEKITGNPFYVELRNRFYGPLGLTSFSIPAFEPIGLPIAHVWLDTNGDMITEDIHDFYMDYMALNSSAGAAGGYFSTATDCTKWMHKYMRGDLHSPAMVAEARTVVSAPGSQGGQYGLGLMKNSFLGSLAYGHGGDLAYHATSWYFPEKDLSITVLNNDDKKNSWDLLPVVRELLRTCMNYEPISGTSDLGSADAINMSVYPNPFQSELTIQCQPNGFGSDIEFELKDALGRTIAGQSKQQRGEVELAHFDDLASLPAGVYFATVQIDEGRTQVIKVIK